MVLLMFLIFETCVGSYYPSIGSMRSIIVPEKIRSTIMNFYRVPVYFIFIYS